VPEQHSAVNVATNARTVLLAGSWAVVSIGGGIVAAIVAFSGWPGLLWSPLGALFAYAGVTAACDHKNNELIALGDRADSDPEDNAASLVPWHSTVASVATVIVAVVAFRRLSPWLAVAATYAAAVATVGVCVATKSLENAAELTPPRGRLLRYAWVRQLWPGAREGIEPIGYVLQVLLTCTLGSIYVVLWLLVEAMLPTLGMVNRYLWSGALGSDATRTFPNRVLFAIVPGVVFGGIGAGIAALLSSY
jgi:hypothetical protein